VQQILLRIPVPGTDWVVTLYGYGAMLCLGFLLAILVAARRARRLGQNPDIIYNAALFCFIGGLLGARLFYVIQYGEHFHSVFDLLKIWEGGLTFYGGFLLAVAATLGYLRVARLPMLYWLDVLAPSVALGVAFGRLGCYLNGCCFGDVCTHGWGTVWPAGSIPWQQYADQHLAAMGVTGGWHAAADAATTAGLLASWQPPAIYPTQLLSFANTFLIFLVLHTFFAFKRRHGQVIFGFILLYGISRFFLEWLRADEASVYLLGLPTLLDWLGLHAQAARLPALTISQNISLVMVAGSVAALWLLAQSRRPEIQGDFVPLAPAGPVRTRGG
jgi:phosphatidylglycerol:prolipoprotein diacylglycerol transferase